MDKMNPHLDGDALCDFAEGAMDAPARAAAETHLQGCADCRRELQAVRGYFRELTALEPVKAPANFLANVRARLPRPSPWKTALMVFLNPLRAIPPQIAILTVLGITVITAYLYQRGGITESPVMLSPAVPPAPGPTAPEAKAKAPQAAPRLPQPASEESPSAAPADDEKTSRLSKDEAKDEDFRANKEDRRSEADKSIALQRESKTRLGGRLGPKQAKAMASLPPPASSPAGDAASPKAPAPAPLVDSPVKAGDAENVSGWADGMTESESAPARPAERSDAKKKESAAPGAAYIMGNQAESAGAAGISASAHSPETQAGRLSAGDNRDAVAPAKRRSTEPPRAPEKARTLEKAAGGASVGAAKAVAPEPLPGLTVRLRNAKDTSVVVAGLKAMGAEIVGREMRKGGRYVLRVPASMTAEMEAYLQRYGKTERRDPPPAEARSAPDSVFLRIILP
ncbi:MAG: hypothetical protein JWO30_2161 [Fibrobacteres bacterium]|nr:hypothetical protein [Fibrobacterota bacterium]